jgi:hypothetical protein
VIGIPICQTLLLDTLRTTIPRYTSAVSPETVINAGPTALIALARADAAVLAALRKAYSLGLQRTYYFALAAGCAAALCTFGMEWKNVKREAEARKGLALEHKGGEEVGGEQEKGGMESSLHSPMETA